MTEEPLDLTEQVAERIHAEWCKQNGADVAWNGNEMTAWEVDAWRAVANEAIAAVEYDHAILLRAGLLVAVYSDGVVDLRWPEDEA